MVSVEMGHQNAIDVMGAKSMAGQLRNEILFGLDLEPGAGHAPPMPGRPPASMRILSFGLDDPRPHGKRRREGWIPSQGRIGPKRTTVGGAALEEGGLELQGSGGQSRDLQGNALDYCPC